MKKLVAALVLGAMLVTISVGCSGTTTPKTGDTKTKTDTTTKPKTP